jgi:hypothetical protein
MAAKLTNIAIQLQLVAESYTICSSRSGQPVRKLLATPSYIIHEKLLERNLAQNDLKIILQMLIIIHSQILPAILHEPLRSNKHAMLPVRQ